MNSAKDYSVCTTLHCDRYAKLRGMCLLHATTASTPVDMLPDTRSSLVLIPKAPSKSKKNKCQSQGCLSLARRYGFCSRHGGGKKCRVESCHTAAQTGGFCRIHGGGSLCRKENCRQFACIRGLCLDHIRDDMTAQQNLGRSNRVYIMAQQKPLQLQANSNEARICYDTPIETSNAKHSNSKPILIVEV